MTGQRSERRFIVASNRLPFVLSRDGEGTWSIEPGSGGLVTALLPVLRNWEVCGSGWPVPLKLCRVCRSSWLRWAGNWGARSVP